jgi:EpsI family protein
MTEPVESTTQSGGLNKDAIMRLLLPALALLACFFAYRGLVGYDPYAGFEIVPDETEGFFFEPTGNSPVLIACVTVWLLFNRRHRIREACGRSASPVWAGLGIGTAIGFSLWATYVGAPDLLVVSLIFMLLGSGALLGGMPGMRAVWLPAVFMLLLLPPPAEFINFVVFPLQLVTAKISVSVLGLIGIPAAQLGDQILTESHTFQVIEACSGMRSIETMAMAGIVFAEFSYRSRLQVVLIVIAGPLIGFLVNQMRVLSLILNPYSEFAGVHTTQGIVMVVGGVLLIAAFDWVLGRVLPSNPSVVSTARDSEPLRGEARLRLVFLLVVFGTLGTANFWLDAWEEDEPLPKSLSSFPARVDGWHVISGQPLDRQYLGSVGISQWLHRRYERDGKWVEAFVAADRRLERRASLISGKTALPGGGWAVVQRRLVELEPDGPVVEESILRARGERRLAYHWREGMERVAVEAFRSALALDQSLLRRPGRALVFRVSTPLRDDETGRAEARQRLQDFAQELDAFYEVSGR